jgi:hypothetical protein
MRSFDIERAILVVGASLIRLGALAELAIAIFAATQLYAAMHHH